MKRIFAVLGMCTTFLSMAGCAVAQTPGNVDNRMDGAFTADVIMNTSESETKGTLTRYGNEAWSVTFTEPAALSGVQLDFIDDDVTASYKGLEFSVPQSAQAVKTMLSELMDIVDDMAQNPQIQGKSDDSQIVLEGEIDEGSYTLTYTADGTPLQFSLPSYGVTIDFENFAETGSTPETSASGTAAGSVPAESSTQTSETVETQAETSAQ